MRQLWYRYKNIHPSRPLAAQQSHLLPDFGTTEIFSSLISCPRVPEVVVIVLVGEDDVEGLEVQVEDPFAVDELDTPHHLNTDNVKMSNQIKYISIWHSL